MMGNNVAVSRAATTSMNTLSDPLSIPPNTHLPSLSLPLLYLRLPNLDSSISTIFPGPPIGANRPSRYAAQTSRQKWHQSTAVLQLISHHLMMVFWGKSSVQRYVISRIRTSGYLGTTSQPLWTYLHGKLAQDSATCGVADCYYVIVLAPCTMNVLQACEVYTSLLSRYFMLTNLYPSVVLTASCCMTWLDLGQV